MTLPVLQRVQLPGWLTDILSDSSLSYPTIFSFAFPSNFILFNYWPVHLFIKPVTMANLHSVQRDYFTACMAQGFLFICYNSVESF